jgi:hypothetical protein
MTQHHIPENFNLGQDIGYPEGGFFGSFTQFAQANAGIVPPLCHDCLLPNPFQVIIYQPCYKSMLSNVRY